MVSTSGTKRDGGNKSPYWRLVETFAIMSCVGVMALGYTNISHIKLEKLDAQQASEKCSAQADEQRCKDSVINRRAVMASENAVDVAVWQTVFNFLGLIGLGGTVVFAGMAWREARRSADADNAALEETRKALLEAREGASEQKDRFERQINLSEDTAKRQLRAYISVHLKSVESLGDGLNPRVSVTFKNDGQTPAHDVVCHGNIAFQPFPLDVELPALDFDGVHRSREPLGPGSPRTIHEKSICLAPGSVALLKAGTWALYAFGEVRYKDIFGESHMTKYRLFMGGEAGMDIGLIAYHEGNESD